LYEELDTTNSTRAKVEAMARYFSSAPAADAAWAVYVLMGRRVKRSVGQSLLHAWLVEEAALPLWLVQETYGSVGDLAETIALLIAPKTAGRSEESLTEWFEARILPLRDLTPPEKRACVVAWWHRLSYRECFLVNKLLTGALRVGVSRSLVTRALAQALHLERGEVERSLIGEWQPSESFWQALSRNEAASLASHPYPFFLASPLAGPPEELGAREAWLAEWKWDGIRGQVVRRAAACTIWSRGEEVVTERFPEIVAAAAALPDGTVLDGEVVAWRDNRVLPFAHLQQRIGRLKLSPKILKEVPAGFIAYDLLERDSIDLRGIALADRRAALVALLAGSSTVLSLSPEIVAASWQDLAELRATARTLGVEGLMLKRWDSIYGVGRQRGAWWKWKIDPFVFDGVLLYAAPGNGRRSNLYTDYTFGVWDGKALVPVAKAYSGLDNQEIAELDRWIRAHTLEKFGIVRSVEPVHVFELAYEGIAKSKRHKSGIALRFPRMVRWRRDKPAGEADRLEDLQRVLETVVAGSEAAPSG
jgi:DNA ligase-1